MTEMVDENEMMDLLRKNVPILADSPLSRFIREGAERAMRVTGRLNTGYHPPDEVRALFSELIGKHVHESFNLFPPLYSDFGRNITVGKNVFINSCCNFQDHGGVTIGDGAYIGHKVVFATLNHDLRPSHRANLYSAPIVVGKNVWIGSNATILQGVTIGDGAIVGAGSVVTKDVPPNTIVAGNPARKVREVSDDDRSQCQASI
ncbi:Maltose O-acyltransferase (MAT)-like protein [Giardia muris]|uniref:Maltose O-acyltransferase (MAT)-like protein n=1 Tax=Giardia muris TaxID=5742 RepID=A0A4Z1SNJ8_GIAMU|nr:Maltose O-acyltransferase (MAT)-like protein [Giardia muris]|eukprot:TNJ27326.1 Maltose O-acyltransferase (MAT)-like protein [Giardia muris]